MAKGGEREAEKPTVAKAKAKAKAAREAHQLEEEVGQKRQQQQELQPTKKAANAVGRTATKRGCAGSEKKPARSATRWGI